MDIFSYLPEDTRKSFIDAVNRADREYQNKIEAVDAEDPFGIRDPFDRERTTKPVAQRAALERLGSLLFYLVDVWSLQDLSDEEFRSLTNVALTSLRHVTLKRYWPKSTFFMPRFEVQRERKFDRALIRWLEGQELWRKYEARLTPQIKDAIAADDSGQGASSPLVYFEVWPLESLWVNARSRIRAGLLEIHGTFQDHKMKDEVECWRRAYNLIADEFAQARLLSEDLVNRRIPEIVADVVAGAGWSDEPLGRVRPTAIFSYRFGSQFYPLWRRDAFLDALQGRMTHWSGRALTKRCATPGDRPLPKQASRHLKTHRRAILKAFIKEKELDGMAHLARRLGVSPTALYGMVRGDSSRHSAEKLDSVLTQIGCTRAKWDRVPKPATRA